MDLTSVALTSQLIKTPKRQVGVLENLYSGTF
jgi:hypothetical protein